MWSKLYKRVIQNEPARLAIAILLSAFVHLWLVFDLSIVLPSNPKVTSLIVVNLENHASKSSSLQKPVIEKTADEPKLVPVKNQKVRKKQSKDTSLNDKTSEELPSPNPEAVKLTPSELPPSVPETNLATETHVEPEAVIKENANQEMTSSVEPAPIPVDGADVENAPPYRKADLSYTVTNGVDGMRLGTVEMHFSTETNHYKITSRFEADFIAKLIIRGTLEQKSEGTIDAQGFSPELFNYDFANKHYEARFDRVTQVLSLKTEKGEKQVPLLDGSQDLLSFMFQFMYVPPLDIMELPITTGRKLKRYQYRFEGEEEITTPVGKFRTFHIMNSSSDDEEKTELWLAMDYRNLPVKIRKTEKTERVIEQTLSVFSAD